MICPECKEEIKPGDLLICWDSPNDGINCCWSDDLDVLRTVFALYGERLEDIDFEHDNVECLYCWKPPPDEAIKMVRELLGG